MYIAVFKNNGKDYLPTLPLVHNKTSSKNSLNRL